MASVTGQVPLPLQPDGAIAIGDAACLVNGEQGGAVLVWGTLWWSWQAGDQAGRRLAAVQLAIAKIAKRVQIAAAFEVTPETVWRWCRDYERDGIAALAPAKPGPKGAWKLTDDIVERIVALDAQGLTQAKIAETVGVSSFSVRQVLRGQAAGGLRPASQGDDAGDDADAHDRDEQTEGGALPVVPAPTPRTDERQAARFGQLVQAEPVFTQGAQLPLAGLLLALPTLEATGLLEVAEATYGKLRNGFYGLRSLLLTLVLLALLREPRAEGATRVVPADLGRILALDRGPEVSTIRRRLGELAEAGQAGELLAGLARQHVDTHPDAVGFLYIDGHVRAYHGTRRLPKTHVARMRISMPATLETWIGDANGDPIFAVIAPPSASTAAEVRRLLPKLRELVDGRATTIVFDRGGWSPDLFADLAANNFDVLTYRKGKIRPEPASAFTEHLFTDERGVTHRWLLADRRVRIRLSAKGAKRHGRKTITLRQIVRLSPDGHQTHILTSRFDLPAGEIAARMFNRWRQENYFRYARAHFALDALDTYTTIDDDPTRSVPNPAKRATRRRVRELEKVVADAEATLGRHRNSTQLSTSLDELETTLDEVRHQLHDARQTAANTPARLPLADVAPDARLLDTETKLLTHACRIAAYNTESALARLIAPHYARANDEARSLLREALTSAGDLHLADGHIHVTLNPLSAPRRTRALAAICQLLNDTETLYPGTNLVLSYTVKPHPGTT
jgi:prepilin-type processing-associated H-X9-DG protein